MPRWKAACRRHVRGTPLTPGRQLQAPGVGLTRTRRAGPTWGGRNSGSSGSRDKGQVRDVGNCSELLGGGGEPWRSRAAPFRSEAGLQEENGEGKMRRYKLQGACTCDEAEAAAKAPRDACGALLRRGRPVPNCRSNRECCKMKHARSATVLSIGERA